MGAGRPGLFDGLVEAVHGGERTSKPDDLRLWDAAAEAYAGEVQGVGDTFYRRLSAFLWDHFGDVSDLEVLDLGCGHGWLSEVFRGAGARVTGVDGSAELLTEARHCFPEVRFEHYDLRLGLPRPLGRYDRIVAHMVLMDVPDLGPLISDVADALSSTGVFVFSILHPAFFSRPIVVEPGPDGERYRKITGYLDQETRWIQSFGGHNHYHRPLSWYFQLLRRHGLVVTDFHEPPSLPADDMPPEEWTEYQRWFATIPTMMAISCRKLGPEPRS